MALRGQVGAGGGCGSGVEGRSVGGAERRWVSGRGGGWAERGVSVGWVEPTVGGGVVGCTHPTDCYGSLRLLCVCML